VIAELDNEDGSQKRTVTITKRTVELFSCQHPEILLEGGVGGGKTFTGGVFIDALCTLYPGIRVLLVRQTRISLNNSVLDTLEGEVWGHGHPVITPTRDRGSRPAYVYPEAETIVDGIRYKGSSRIDLGGMDNPDRIMSTQYDVIWAVEATELLQSAWEKMSTRVRRFYVQRWGKPFSLMIADCNPGPKRHWLNLRAEKVMLLDEGVRKVLGLKAWESRKVKQMQRIRMTIKDNPKFWDAEAEEWTHQGAGYMMRLGGLSGADFERLVNSLWVDTSGMVYPEFDPDTHVVAGRLVASTDTEDHKDDYRKWWLVPNKVPVGDGMEFEPDFTERAVAWFGISTDYGYKPDPTVIKLWAVDEKGHSFRVKVWYKTRTPFDEWAKLIAELQRTYDVRAIVSEGPQERVDTLNRLLGNKLSDKGQPIATMAKKGAGSIKAGIDRMRWALKTDEDTGEPRQRYLAGALQHEPDEHLEALFWPTDDVQEFDRYAYAEAKEDKPNKDEPIDMHNHGMDADRYWASYTWSNTHSAPNRPTADHLRDPLWIEADRNADRLISLKAAGFDTGRKFRLK
jgi:hypothetical protein